MKNFFYRLAVPFRLFFIFAAFTLSVMFVDASPIGPQGSSVGFAVLNGWFHDLVGVNMALYTVTDWAGLVPVLMAFGFAVLGLCQLIARRSFLRVDRSILVLGGFYLLVAGAYLFFEYNVVNFRPVLIDGYLEASYPSSTTMLALCVMPTAMAQFRRLIRNKKVCFMVNILCGVYTVFMVLGRLLSGVHWLTDVLGGVLLSAALVSLYFAACGLAEREKIE